MQFNPDQILPSHDLFTGKASTISGWRLGKKLHEGRWLVQYEAATMGSDSAAFDYVFKTIKPGLSKNMLDQAISRLSAEAMVTEQVHQKNIVPLLDAELDYAPFFIIQPLVRGASLSQLFESHQPIPLSRMLWLVRQVAEALSAVHDNHRTYTGVHPSHILISQAGEVSLIGWGNSLSIGEPLKSPLGQSAVHRYWLAHYAAPEMFEANYVANEASDVYSLGALIYRLFSGQPPHDANQFDKLKRSIQNEIHADLQIAQESCPGALNQLVNQMLSKSPTRRPNMKVLLDQLISLEIEFLQDHRSIEI
jgi:serine/threonine protein kinase